MDREKNDTSALVAGIESDAKNEAEQLLQEARQKSEERMKYVQKQADSILKEAAEKADRQADAVQKKILSGVEIEVRRKSMQIKDRIMGEILNQVRKKLSELISGEEYKDILFQWIVEAGLGLGAEHAFVNASQGEKDIIDSKLLVRAARKVEDISGIHMEFSLSDDNPLGAQGVVLYSEDGKTAFNNQVSTRILRKQREIRDVIYTRLFDEEG
jgi:vacuolar-type H+-ATPase subunit E/Vma4